MSSLRSIADWRPRTRFFYGWLVLGTAALGAFAATGVAQVVLGGIQSLIFEDMGWDRSTIAYGVTAGTWASGLLTPLFGRLADRHGPRGLMPVGLVVLGVCLFGLAGIRAVWHFYVAYIIARSIANPILIGVVPRTAAVNFFHRRRNLALALQSMARPVAGAINIQVISLIARGYSWRVAYRALGVFALALIVPMFLVMRRRPEDIGLRPDGDRLPAAGPVTPGTPAQASASVPGPLPSEQRDWRAREATTTSTFWLIVAAEALIILTSGAIGFQTVPYLKDSGLSQTYAAVALSLASLLGALGNPAWGHLADRLSPRRLALFIIPGHRSGHLPVSDNRLRAHRLRRNGCVGYRLGRPDHPRQHDGGRLLRTVVLRDHIRADGPDPAGVPGVGADLRRRAVQPDGRVYGPVRLCGVRLLRRHAPDIQRTGA